MRARGATTCAHPASESDLQSHVTHTLAAFKRPRRVLFRDSLPRNPTGKLLKRDLRSSLVSS